MIFTVNSSQWCIINNELEIHKILREGKLVSSFFESLNKYQIENEFCENADEMKFRLEKIQNMKELNHFDSILMFVMSHKDEDFTYNDKKENVQKSKFVDALEKNQYLADKQKLIYFNLKSSRVKIKENFLIIYPCTRTFFEADDPCFQFGRLSNIPKNYILDVLDSFKLQPYQDIEQALLSVNGVKKCFKTISHYENRLKNSFTFE